MAEIRESRYSKIENRIVTREGVFKLASLVHQEYLSAKQGTKHCSVSYMVTCSDNSSFESEDPSIFDKESFLISKKVETIEITYHQYETNSYINISLRHGSDYGNSITVRGTDSTWVNGITKKLEEAVDSFQPQNTFVKKHKWMFNVIFGLSLGAIFIWIIMIIPSDPPKDQPPAWVMVLRSLFERFPPLRLIFKYLLGLPVGIFPASLLTEKLIALWPSIEIQVGPDHTLLEKKRRKWILNVVIMGVLPLLLSLIYDIVSGKMF